MASTIICPYVEWLNKHPEYYLVRGNTFARPLIVKLNKRIWPTIHVKSYNLRGGRVITPFPNYISGSNSVEALFADEYFVGPAGEYQFADDKDNDLFMIGFEHPFGSNPSSYYALPSISNIIIKTTNNYGASDYVYRVVNGQERYVLSVSGHAQSVTYTIDYA